MGYFGTHAYSGGEWVGETPTSEPYLVIEIHDSDIAIVDYAPVAGASGRFYLGVEPRVYFEDESASAAVDKAAEARGFAQWLKGAHGRDVDASAIAALMPDDDPDTEPLDVFVEETFARLLELAGLPLPPELAPGSDFDAMDASHVAGAAASVPGYMDMAKAVLAEDKTHATIAFLFRDGEAPDPMLADYTDDEEKDHFFREVLPAAVREQEADGVLVIAEATSADGDLLTVFAAQRDGLSAALATPFAKKFPRRIVFGETEGADGSVEMSALDPVRAVWARG